MIDRANVSACLVTRGDLDLTQILETLDGFGEIIVWDNSQENDGRGDLGIYGRYAAALEASNKVVVTQDDDLLVTCWDDILAAYQPGVLTVNYPEPWDIPWVARGAVFDRNLPQRAFRRYWRHFPMDGYFTHLACDGVFALLTDTNVIDHGSVDLPAGFQGGRVSTSPGWYTEARPLIQARCAQIMAAACA